MDRMYRINEQKRGTGKVLSRERSLELKNIQKEMLDLSNQLKECKDCEEWFCVFCDNENCYNNEKTEPCFGNDPGRPCDSRRDIPGHCKDCDELACVGCDNEPTKKTK